MTATEQASAWCHWLASRGCPISQDEMRAMFIAGIEAQVKPLEMIIRERIFWTANDPVFNRQGYSCFIDREMALLAINYRDAELHPTIEQAISAAKEYMADAIAQKGNP